MIYAATYKQSDGVVNRMAGPSRWASCWGVFESNWDLDLPENPLAVISIQTFDWAYPIQVALVESKWFKELIGDDSVKILGRGTKVAAEAHGHTQYTARHFADSGWTAAQANEKLLTIEAPLYIAADRFISAMRLLTSFTRGDRPPENIPENLIWTWPIVCDFLAAHGRPFSDSICTFYPVTAGEVRAYCDEKDWDLDDVDLEDILCDEAFIEEAQATEGALLEILKRTEKEFSFLSEQTSPISGGYCKDDNRMMDTSLADDEVLSVMAPVMATPQGNVVTRTSVYKLLAQHLN